MGHYDSFYEHDAKLQAEKRRNDLEAALSEKLNIAPCQYTSEEIELLVWVFNNTAKLSALRHGLQDFIKLR